MSERRIVTKKEFLEFIFAQDDDRELSFNQIQSDDPCGCPMIHFGKHVGLHDFGVNTNEWRCVQSVSSSRKDYKTQMVFEPEFDVFCFMFVDANNYGELKGYMLSYDHLKPV